MTYTRYEIAINDKSNRFANRIEIEELIERAIRLEGLGIGADVEVITMDVITVPVDVEAPNIRREIVELGNELRAEGIDPDALVRAVRSRIDPLLSRPSSDAKYIGEACDEDDHTDCDGRSQENIDGKWCLVSCECDCHLNDPVVIQDDGSGNQVTASGRVLR